ncbi:hypothetical protein A3H10_00175 [Candidatus Uhrbacteria bacterium RIFCSPLOWO2_12_FULL_46_10]|nr:MAG: hypothetical protein UX68_C0018G0008 [Parcubacteria group bacterium GW2011_GWA2_46_9]OGL58872.1 MAG: hypothetical protein A2752_04810 [Candidatus Uhrbacteria bacterium RIFCSPHIGHO2_01_FULL_46_23]OGL91239.1 MAG: hypothetical protein A3H10_00175 [Candidatus Uhrbacteria bacterium RIFCSPLOWO2_12_FULL_46_10]
MSKPILAGAPLGSSAKFAQYVICQGHRPTTLDQVTSHFENCTSCQREVDKYKADLNSDKWRNRE